MHQNELCSFGETILFLSTVTEKSRKEIQSQIHNKRYSKIDQHLAQHSKHYAECLSCPPPFLCSQIITPFSHLRISTNQETGL